jgi:hypothetical protein
MQAYWWHAGRTKPQSRDVVVQVWVVVVPLQILAFNQAFNALFEVSGLMNQQQAVNSNMQEDTGGERNTNHTQNS